MLDKITHHLATLVLKCGIYHFVKWQIWPYDTKMWNCNLRREQLEISVKIRQANQEKGAWRIGSALDCLDSHACVQGSNPADLAWEYPCFSRLNVTGRSRYWRHLRRWDVDFAQDGDALRALSRQADHILRMTHQSLVFSGQWSLYDLCGEVYFYRSQIAHGDHTSNSGHHSLLSNPFSAGIDIRRQNLKNRPTNVRFQSKVDRCTERVKYFQPIT